MDATGLHSPARALQRGNGAARIAFARAPQGAKLADLYCRDPLRVLLPRGEPGEPPCAVVITTSGGLAGGDRLDLRFDIGQGATACGAGQAAEKIYRSTGATTEIAVSLDVAAGARFAWLPQECILFDGARLRRTMDIALGADAELLVADMTVFGRIARGETFATGAFADRWTLRREGRLVWHDALRVKADDLRDPAAFGSAEAMAGIIHAAQSAPTKLEELRERLPACGVASVVNGLLLVRFLGPAREVRAALVGALEFLRGAPLPRLWYV